MLDPYDLEEDECTCSACNGYGTIGRSNNLCPHCNGYGVIKQEKV